MHSIENAKQQSHERNCLNRKLLQMKWNKNKNAEETQ